MKNKVFQRIAKRVLASILALTMLITAVPSMTAFAAVGTTKYSYDGYEVEYNVTGEWSTGQNVEVKVTNTSDQSILNWAFRYDAGSEIVNIWNATIVENKGTEYVVKNNGWNYEILPQQSVSFGYTLAQGDIPVSKEFELFSKRVEVTNGYEMKLNVINAWGNGAQAEIIISNTSNQALEAWEIAFDCNFSIDGFWGAREVATDKDYGFASEVWSNPIPAGGSVSIGFTASIDGEMKIDNFSMTEVEIEKLEIDWEDETDTDGDMLPDVYEIHAYETDPRKVDTDGDNLPDGYEVLNLYTNPTMTDTDNNGISDDLEDFDADGLTNYDEYKIGTKPYGVDSDEDYLNDGDEVNVYGTNPLNPDTDGDGILDGDEIYLGLFPNDGTDGSTPIKQAFSEEDLHINEYNNDFKVSIELEASNNVGRFLEQEESVYSGFLADNRAIVGTPISLKYEAGVVSGGSITFRLEEEFADNNAHYYPELGLGIERYGVFCYDESIATIVPVPCDYNEENNSITVDARYMGDLFLLDYESLMYDLGVEPEVSTYVMRRTEEAITFETERVEEVVSNEVTEYEDVSLEEIESIIAGDSGMAMYSLRSGDVESRRTSQSQNTMRQVDLVLAVDTTGSMGSQIATVKRNLSSLINRLREDDISLYVSIVDYRDITCDGVDSTKVNNNSGVDFYNSESDISAAISSLTPWGGGDGPETAIDALGAAYYLGYRDTASKFIFLITDANYKNNNNYGITSMSQIASRLESKEIVTSVVTYSSYNSYYRDLTECTGGELISMSGNFCDAMYRVIEAKTPDSFVVIANNLVTGSFKEPLVYGGTCDTDGDTLTDSAEVDWKNVKKVNKEDGTYTLYTWKELCKKGWIFSSTYDDGKNHPLFELLADVQVIPATSNPFSKDTDKDYYPDNVDEKVLVKTPMWIDDVGIDDSEFHSDKIVEPKYSGKYTDGKLSVDNSEQRAVYAFERKVNEYAYFKLVPKGESFYKISCSDSNVQIEVTYKKGFLYKQTEFVKPQNGSYLLHMGEEYTIKAYGFYSSGKYELVVEQDNWEEASEGGVWEVLDYNSCNNYSPTEALFITPELIVGATVGNISSDNEIHVAYTEEQIKKIMAMVPDESFSSLSPLFDEIDDWEARAGFVLFFINPKKKLLNAAVKVVGTGLTIYGWGSGAHAEFVKYKRLDMEEALRDGNLNIAHYKYRFRVYDSYAPWTSDGYIRKIVSGNAGKITCSLDVRTVQEMCGFLD